MERVEPAKLVKPIIPIKKNQPQWSQERLTEQLEEWRRSLQEQDRSPGTVKKLCRGGSTLSRLV